MKYIGDKEYWDTKFHARGETMLSPEQALIDNIERLKPGSVLDIACGDGRNALYLLSKGFQVKGIDFSEIGLERLKNFSQKAGYSVETKQVDLNDRKALDGIGVFDNIVINHYKLNDFHFHKLSECLTDGGTIFICGFGEKHETGAKIKKNDLIRKSDFEVLKKSFDLIEYNSKDDERGTFETYIFKKI